MCAKPGLRADVEKISLANCASDSSASANGLMAMPIAYVGRWTTNESIPRQSRQGRARVSTLTGRAPLRDPACARPVRSHPRGPRPLVIRKLLAWLLLKLVGGPIQD